MNYIKFARYLLGFALLGCVLFGTILGFFIEKENLDLARSFGALIAVIFAFYFHKKFIN